MAIAEMTMALGPKLIYLGKNPGHGGFITLQITLQINYPTVTEETVAASSYSDVVLLLVQTVRRLASRLDPTTNLWELGGRQAWGLNMGVVSPGGIVRWGTVSIRLFSSRFVSIRRFSSRFVSFRLDSS